MPLVTFDNEFHTQENPFSIAVPAVPVSAEESGNSSLTDSFSPAKGNSTVKCNPCFNWFFTYNNPNEKFKDFLLNCYRVTDCVFQLEVGASGTPHYQGIIRFDCKARPKSVFGEEWNAIHWMVAHDVDDCVRYCQKPISKDGKGKRLKGPWFKGKKWKREVELKILKDEQLYTWQKDIISIIETEPDDRKIYWIWEETGNAGKTSFCKYLSVKHQAVLLTGKSADMKYAIAEMGDYPRIVLIDCPRSMMDYISYPGIEEIKNAYFFAGKYESRQIIGNSPHLFIFANAPPDMDKLSKDRWIVIHI